MYEKRFEPLLTRKKFYIRLLSHLLTGAIIMGISLGIGVLGYHGFEHLSWLDSLLNASMILGGMGPVTILQSDGGKWFASFYALFSGMIFLGVFGIIIAPVIHRLLHLMHMDESEDN
ncbi:MAG: hypothetical protein CVU42_01575 [Chloroflexi bacterium HGW-Chloroflexi-4]|jgi:hypothetical protein|nr:MAG: hypothetical protein CVU42_01575 [Chloroflexi bacterium HGW-Chloroflexi-4]